MYSSQGNNSYNEQMFYGLEWQNLLCFKFLSIVNVLFLILYCIYLMKSCVLYECKIKLDT